MNSNNIWTTIEHGAAGIVLVSVPLLLNGIPASWQNMTVGAILGLIWGIIRTYLTPIAS